MIKNAPLPHMAELQQKEGAGGGVRFWGREAGKGRAGGPICFVGGGGDEVRRVASRSSRGLGGYVSRTYCTLDLAAHLTNGTVGGQRELELAVDS